MACTCSPCHRRRRGARLCRPADSEVGRLRAQGHPASCETRAKRDFGRRGPEGPLFRKKPPSRVLRPCTLFHMDGRFSGSGEARSGPFRARARPAAGPNPGHAARTRRAPKKGTLQCLVRAFLARARARNAKQPAFSTKTGGNLDAPRPCSGKRIYSPKWPKTVRVAVFCFFPRRTAREHGHRA
jgi:hypothetical protein